MILRPLQKLLKNVGDLGKSIVVKGFEKLTKVQKIARSGHTGHFQQYCVMDFYKQLKAKFLFKKWAMGVSPVVGVIKFFGGNLEILDFP